jgi:hypothetical protein
MSEVTKVTMPVAMGGLDDRAYVTKLVMYVAFSNVAATPRRRIIHGKISYNKRMA